MDLKRTRPKTTILYNRDWSSTGNSVRAEPTSQFTRFTGQKMLREYPAAKTDNHPGNGLVHEERYLATPSPDNDNEPGGYHCRRPTWKQEGQAKPYPLKSGHGRLFIYSRYKRETSREQCITYRFTADWYYYQRRRLSIQRPTATSPRKTPAVP
ncbi:hypothetical protein B0O80DRAFT_429203 [Mortierella sp. GBAus27b]|nr:hypothetical protein B0O80DRAFT_429203 [Mortierella sp. GBAus27b]